MDTPGNVARLIFAGSVILMAALAMAVSWVAAWLDERRRTRVRLASPAAAGPGGAEAPSPARGLERVRKAA